MFVCKHKVHICGVCVNFRHLYNVALSEELVALPTSLKQVSGTEIIAETLEVLTEVYSVRQG